MNHFQKFTWITAAMLSSCTLFAQDVIITIGDDRIPGKVTDISEGMVWYQVAQGGEELVKSIPADSVAGIRYADNHVVIITPVNGLPTEQPPGTQDLAQQAQKDCYNYYPGVGPGAEAISATTLILTPVVGIIPTIICASAPPAERNLNYPDETLFNDETYRKAYKSKAHRMKRNEIWTAYGTSSEDWICGVGRVVVDVLLAKWLGSGSVRSGTVYRHRS